VAVVRLSGPTAWQVAAQVVQTRGAALTDRPAGHFFYARFQAPATGEHLDEGLVLLFRGPASFTGEDVVELHGHGSPVLVRAVLRAVLAAGARLAGPGEFTRRAFLHGKIDLTQAEAVMDLVQAQSERAARAAQAQLCGQLGAQVAEFYRESTALCAEVAAQLDFEAEELPAWVAHAAAQRVAQLQTDISQLLRTSREGQLLRAGALVVMGGCPNAGKSSLLNLLLGSRRAIVSHEAGTTRDTLEEGIVLAGIPVRLVDTAGVREPTSPIEREGVTRAHQALQQADLILYLLDAARPLAAQHPHLMRQAFGPTPPPILLVWNKCDLAAPPPCDEELARCVPLALRPDAARNPLRISAQTGAGLAELQAALVACLGVDPAAPARATITERHRQELAQTAEALAQVGGLLDRGELVLAAGELRRGAEALGRILGRTYSQDLLDAIFARFCVGK
jgi:tRNA modification GTPase